MISVAFITTPSFVVAIFLLLIFSLALHWLPVTGAGEPDDPLDRLAHLILPATALAIGWVGYIARLIRASLLEVLSEQHVRMMRAYGVPEYRIVGRFALKLALVPMIAVLGLGMAELIGNAVFAEIIFARPGIGTLVYNSIMTRNYPGRPGGHPAHRLCLCGRQSVRRHDQRPHRSAHRPQPRAEGRNVIAGLGRLIAEIWKDRTGRIGLAPRRPHSAFRARSGR